MTIKVYPSLMAGDPIEQHECAGCTIGEWLNREGIAYQGRSFQPIEVSANGLVLPVDTWAEYEVDDDDDICIRIVPQGGVFGAIGSIIGAVFDFALGWLMPGTPDVNNNQTPQGQQLESANASANVAKLGAVVPETAGRFRRFPEYLTMPRRYFASPREKITEFLCCIGPGQYQILRDDIKIADTPIDSLGDGAECFIFPPGADLSGTTAHENWYSVEEVGGTSSGSAGLELSSTFSSEVNPTAAAYTFNNRTITIAPADGKFPEGWGTGTVLDIRVPQTYAVSLVFVDETPRNRFTGSFREVAPFVGMQIAASNVMPPNQSYVVSGASIDGAGEGWLELTADYGGGPELVGSVPEGLREIVFCRPTRRYVVESAGEQEVTIGAFDTGGLEPGWAGFPPITSASATIATDANTIYGDWTSIFSATPAAEATDTIELDFFFPGGLAHISDDGDLEARGVEIQIQYRDRDLGGPFTSINKTYVNATLDQIGYTERFTIAAMRPEVRVRRVGAASTSTQDKDEVQWSGLKSRLPTVTTYPAWTTASVRLAAAGRLGSQSENKYNVVCTRILPVLQPDGTWGTPQPTRDISAFVRHIAQTIGYTDDQLDIDEFLRLHAIWTARGETADFVYDETTVSGAIKTALAAGMAELTVSEGLIRPVRDDPRTIFEQVYSNHETLDGITRTAKTRRIDDADGLEVEFIDGATWTKTVVRCFLPEDQGFKVAKKKLDAVTDRTRAWRIGMRQRRVMRYRPWSYAWETELDALNSDYLSYVALLDDIPGYGQSSILEHIAPLAGRTLMVCDEPLRWVDGAQHVVAYRRPDGSLAGPFECDRGPDEFSVLTDVPQPWPEITLKMEPPRMYFGTAENWTFPALVTDIKPNGLESVSVEGTNYSPLVYLDDDAFPPEQA